MLSGGGLAEGMVGMADRFGGWWDRQADRWSWQRKRVWISERGLADCPDLVSQMWIRLQDNSRIGSGANALLMKTCFICFVYIQSVTLYEKLDFYDCGFAAFPSAAVKLRFWRPSTLRLSPGWFLFFTGGLLDCLGTLTGHKLTPWLAVWSYSFTRPWWNTNCAKILSVCFNLLWAADGWRLPH